MKVKSNHRSKFSNLSNWKEEAWKNQGFNGIRTRDLRDTGACFTSWVMKPHIGSEVNLVSSYLPVQWNDVKFIWNYSYLYCGCRWKWRVIIAVNFPILGIGKKRKRNAKKKSKNRNAWRRSSLSRPKFWFLRLPKSQCGKTWCWWPARQAALLQTHFQPDYS